MGALQQKPILSEAKMLSPAAESGDSPTNMLDYRACIVGPDGHVQKHVDLRCANEAEAIRLAKKLVDGRDVAMATGPKIETFKRRLEPTTTPPSLSVSLDRPLISVST
jgi:hypothetical protein